MHDASSTGAAMAGQTAPAGIYIHVPFCRAKCRYCDFASITDLGRIPEYLDALAAELKGCRERVGAADTVYLGGGTPSLLTPRQIAGILEIVRRIFPVADDAEITLEANPGTVSLEALQGYRAAGINRCNIGLQSMDDRSLRFLGRIHTARQGCDTYRWARRAGFDNVGLDLIYGLPGQRLTAWRRELADVAALGADHLSCYTLTLEPGTPLTGMIANGTVDRPEEGRVGDLFSETVAWLAANGYRQYEISNFARHTPHDSADRRSRHNRKYWTFAPYLGFGPSAHSFQDNRRWWNHRGLDAYLADVAAGRPPVAGSETLTREQRLIEFVYLGLRQTDGIDASDFASRFGGDRRDDLARRARVLLGEGLLKFTDDRIRLTSHGMRYLDSVIGRLLD